MSSLTFSHFYPSDNFRVVVAAVYVPDQNELKFGTFSVRNNSAITPMRAVPFAMANARRKDTNKVFVTEVVPTKKDFLEIADMMGPELLRKLNS